MDSLPAYISITFVLTTVLTIVLFYRATWYSKKTLLVLLVWLGVQSIIGMSGFYTVTDTSPPRFLLLVGPPMACIIGLFATVKGRQYIDSLDAKYLTLVHTVRFPVELILFWLFIQGTIPKLMTFEGRNFDVLSGLTAPLIFYFGFIKKSMSKKTILIWNFICLCLWANVVFYGVLSAPSPFQQFAFDQPNRALINFPFIWIPCCIVPLVLFSHLATVRQMYRQLKAEK